MSRPIAQEEWLLRLLLETDDFVEWVAAHLELDWIPHPAVRQMVAARLEAHASQSWPGLASWLSQLENPAWKNLITAILTDKRSSPASEATLIGNPLKPGLVQSLRDKFVERQSSALQQRLANPELSDAEKLETLTQLQHLRTLKRQPLAARGEC